MNETTVEEARIKLRLRLVDHELLLAYLDNHPRTMKIGELKPNPVIATLLEEHLELGKDVLNQGEVDKQMFWGKVRELAHLMERKNHE